MLFWSIYAFLSKIWYFEAFTLICRKFAIVAISALFVLKNFDPKNAGRVIFFDKYHVWWRINRMLASKLRHTVRIRFQGTSPEVGWKYSNGVWKSEMGIIWYQCQTLWYHAKKINEKVQSANFGVFARVTSGALN